MNQVDKKYIILGSLCALLLMLVVGYAAFNAVLDIKGTTTISSNWNIQITGIEKLEGSKGVDAEGTPTYDNTNIPTATFNTSFTTPGEYATYKIEITNNGDLDAVLKSIEMPENTNKDIVFYLNKNQNDEEISGALKQNDTLYRVGQTGNVGYVYVTVLYKDYEKQQSPINDADKTASMTITFDFEQAGENEGIITEEITSDYTGVLYSKNILPYNSDNFNNQTWIKENCIFPGDSVEKIKGYAKTSSNTLGNFYLKHIMNNGQVESSELCFIKDSQVHCLKPNEYVINKNRLLNIYGESACHIDSSELYCSGSEFLVYAIEAGYAHAFGGSVACAIGTDGGVRCYEWPF